MGFYKPTVSVSQFNSLQTQVNTNTTNISSLQTSVNTNTTNINNIITQAVFLNFPVGGWKSHGWSNGASATSVITTSNGSTSSALDAFPFLVVETSVVCDKMGIAVTNTSPVSTAGTTKMVLGVYTNNSGYPGTLIAQTGEIDVSTSGWKEAPFTGGNITLNSGWYWIARLSGADTRVNGLNCIHAFPCSYGIATASDPNVDQTNAGISINGVRYTYASYPGATLPSTFPSIASGAKWLSRQFYASPFIHRLS